MIFTKREQVLLGVIIVGGALLDSINDLQDGAHWTHVVSQLTVGTLILAVVIWTMRLRVRKMETAMRASDERLVELRREADQWRGQVAALKPRLGEAIDHQFTQWTLTNAEKDIARLLLKGLTNKEIADVRSSSELTIKQQINALFKKSGLTSRTQLLAFFLEDLF